MIGFAIYTDWADFVELIGIFTIFNLFVSQDARFPVTRATIELKFSKLLWSGAETVADELIIP